MVDMAICFRTGSGLVGRSSGRIFGDRTTRRIKEGTLYSECKGIVDRLRSHDVGEHLEAINSDVDDADFRLLA